MKYKVCTRCVTFNHEPYILDALGGFVMQQTTFPVVYVLVDDASTDKTAELIKVFVNEHFDLQDKSVAYEKEAEYAHVIFARHKTNMNCYFAVLLLRENHYSQRKPKRPYYADWSANAKYHAVCEGDDYWIDPLKLQRQVDFLDSHPEHSMCFHAVENVTPAGGKQLNSRYEKDVEDCPIEDFFKVGGRYAPTCSLVYKGDVLEPRPSFYQKTKVGDSPLILTMFLRGKVGFLKAVMGRYRVDVPGSWSQRQKQLAFPQIIGKFKAGRAYWDEVDKYTEGKYVKLIRQRKRHTWLTLGKLCYYFIVNKFVALKGNHVK